MPYRHKNHDKTPGLLSSQQLLSKRDLQRVVRDAFRFVSYTVKACKVSHGNGSHHERSDLSFFQQLLILNKCSFRKTHNAQKSLRVVESKNWMSYRRKLKLRECSKDMNMIIKSLVWSVANSFWQKEICSHSLWTKVGPCNSLCVVRS